MKLSEDTKVTLFIIIGKILENPPVCWIFRAIEELEYYWYLIKRWFTGRAW